jgi:hypothetical protein
MFVIVATDAQILGRLQQRMPLSLRTTQTNDPRQFTAESEKYGG